MSLERSEIDRAFVRNLETAAEDRALNRAVVDMARALGLSVIAEGVENLVLQPGNLKT